MADVNYKYTGNNGTVYQMAIDSRWATVLSLVAATGTEPLFPSEQSPRYLSAYFAVSGVNVSMPAICPNYAVANANLGMAVTISGTVYTFRTFQDESSLLYSNQIIEGSPGTNGTNGTNGAPGAAGTNGTNGTNGGVNGLRLYTNTGAPFDSSAGATSTLFIGPAFGKGCVFDNGSGVLSNLIVGETAVTMSGLTTGTIYDAYFNGTATSIAAWTNATTPPTRGSDALGRPTKNGATAYLWIGSFVAVSATTTQDDTTCRCVANAYNQVLKGMLTVDNATSFTCASSTYANADSNAVLGVQALAWLQVYKSAVLYFMMMTMKADSGSDVAYGSINVDGSSVVVVQTSATVATQVSSTRAAPAAPGTHALQNQVKGNNANTMTFYGYSYGSASGLQALF